MSKNEKIEAEFQRVSAELAKKRQEANRLNTLIPTLTKLSSERDKATAAYHELSQEIKDLKARQTELQEGGEVRERHYLFTLRKPTADRLVDTEYFVAPLTPSELIPVMLEAYGGLAYIPFIVFSAAVADTDLKDYPEQMFELPWLER